MCVQSVHVINPLSTEYLYLQEGAISLVRFAPSNENCLAVVIGGGQVVFWELNLQEQAVSKVSSMQRTSVWERGGYFQG